MGNLDLPSMTVGSFSEYAFNDGVRRIDAALTAEGVISVVTGNVSLSLAAGWNSFASFAITGVASTGRKVTLPAGKGIKVFRNTSSVHPVTITSGGKSVSINYASAVTIYGTGVAGGFFVIGQSLTTTALWPGTDTPVETVFSDFKNGVYRIGGVSKTLADVWESNPDWGTFNPARVVSGTGLVSASDGYPTLTPTAYAAVTPGGVGFVGAMSAVVGTTNTFGLDWVALPLFSNDGGVTMGVDFIEAFTTDTNINNDDSTAGISPTGPVDYAFGVTPDLSAIKSSLGGQVAASSVNASPSMTAIALGLGGFGGGDHVIEKIIFYQVAADLDLAIATL